MFEPRHTPRFFALPPGCDYSRALVEGLRTRLSDAAPEAIARVELYVNTRRMQRRLKALFAESGAGFLPRIALVTDLAEDPHLADLPPPVPALRRRLELAEAVAQLLDSQPDLAPRAAIYDLADSLAGLMDEMRGEGIAPEDLRRLDVSDFSAHWERSLAFIDVIARYWTPDQPPDTEERQRHVVEHLAARWREAPPHHPVIVAGSTGSRGATALFMQAVARLPQGAVVLPGFDFDMGTQAWGALDDALTGEDHPQFRFRRLMQGAGIAPEDIRPWSDTAPANRARNRLVSLALRPAPVTDQWLAEGPHLPDIDGATRDMTLVEASSPRAEALAIALRLRAAAEAGETAALITPDRVLTRRVTAALDRWGIVPDDSAGQPLPLSAPGRLFRQVAALFGVRLTVEHLLALLKHPLVHSAPGTRDDHTLRTQRLELDLRRHGPAFPTGTDLRAWAARQVRDPGAIAWADWLAAALDGLERIGTRPLTDHVAQHVALTERLAAGVGAAAGTAGRLWEESAGEEARKTIDALVAETDAGGSLSPADYAALFRSVLDREEVRNAVQGHPAIMIWGTLEARVQGADVVILGSLNEGIWPQIPPPDPWLNRQMRKAAGLLLPERRIGLSAHDFQQAVAAPEVMLTRAIRDAEAPTVASRWLNRLTNLLGGIGAHGARSLEDMKARGQVWLDRAAALETPVTPLPPAPRPAPRPPVAARPAALSVTRIKTLIRDPYAIYARDVLRLKPLDPLRPQPDAPLRGTLVHEVLHHFVDETRAGLPAHAEARLMEIATAVMERSAPWPAARRIWLAQLARVAAAFLQDEAARRAEATPLALEVPGKQALDGIDFSLTVKADRVDRTPDGKLLIYDYKTGAPPSEKEVTHFDRQLPLEAAMAERGGFEGVAPAPVAGLRYIGLGAKPGQVAISTDLVRDTWDELHRLVAAYATRETGYASRARLQRRTDTGDYDHLARHGEWDDTAPPTPEDVE